MTEGFFEQKFDLPEESEKHDENQAAEIKSYGRYQENLDVFNDLDTAFQFDVIVHGRKEASQEFTKENILTTIETDPDASDIFYLKEKVADPLMRSEDMRKDREFQGEVRDAVAERYQTFLFPGHVTKSGIKPPESLGFVVQKMDLAKAGLLRRDDQLYYYDPAHPENIPPKILKRGLTIAPSEDERREESPTMAVFDTTRRLGFDYKCSESDMKFMTFANVLAARVDVGRWLGDTARNFYDENDMTLMKLNRLLPVASLTGLIRDLTQNEELTIRGNPNFKKDADEVMARVANQPLSPTLIAKYGLDKPGRDGKSIIEKQKESVAGSREYLESGKNVAVDTNIGRMIYVKADERGHYEKLPGSVSAIAGQEEGRAPVNGYVEVTPNRLLAFFRTASMNGQADFLKKAATKHHLHIQIVHLDDGKGGWERASILNPNEQIIADFENNVFKRNEAVKSGPVQESDPSRERRHIQKHRKSHK